MSEKISKLILFMLGITLGAMFSLYLAHPNPPAKTYVYIDVDRIISSIVQKVSKSNTEDLTANIGRLKQRFERALTDYEQMHNAIIFSSPKPIKGAVNKTDYFIERIKNEDKHDEEKAQ